MSQENLKDAIFSSTETSPTFSERCDKICKIESPPRKRPCGLGTSNENAKSYVDMPHSALYRPRSIFRTRSEENSMKKEAGDIGIETEPLQECKPFASESEFLVTDGSAHHDDSREISRLSEDVMDDYHHDLDGVEVVEEIIVPSVPEDVQADEQPINDEYKQDIEFQRWINRELLKLSDDEKVIMKFNIQKILLDAKFGMGTARNIVNREELIEVEGYVEIDPNQVLDEIHL